MLRQGVIPARTWKVYSGEFHAYAEVRHEEAAAAKKKKKKKKKNRTQLSFCLKVRNLEAECSTVATVQRASVVGMVSV